MAGRVFGASDLLEYHLGLALDFVGLEDRVPNRVDQHVEAGGKRIARHRGVIHGHVEGGVGVDATPSAFYFRSDIANAAALGALEEHVLVKVCEALFAGTFIGRAHQRPDLKIRYRGKARLAQQQREAVGQPFKMSMGLGHGARLAALARAEAAAATLLA